MAGAEKPNRFRPRIKLLIVVALVGLLVSAIALLTANVIVTAIDHKTRPIPFDARIWKRDAENGSDVRRRMGEYLVQSGLLVGATKQKVLEMLGPPAPKGFPFGGRDWDLVYLLGPEPGPFSIDDEWLMFRFSPKGLVTEERTYID